MTFYTLAPGSVPLCPDCGRHMYHVPAERTGGYINSDARTSWRCPHDGDRWPTMTGKKA